MTLYERRTDGDRIDRELVVPLTKPFQSDMVTKAECERREQAAYQRGLEFAASLWSEAMKGLL